MKGVRVRVGQYHAAITLALILVSGCGADSEVDADPAAPAGFDGAAAMRPEAGPATLIGPGTLSADGGESWISFNPEQSIAVFGRHSANWGDHQVHMTLRTEDDWSEPQLAPIFGSDADRGARFSVDGGVVFYSSNRPRAGQDEQALYHFDIWLIQLHEDGWGQPRPLPAPLNTTSNQIHPSVALDGTVYFASDREGGLGRSALYKTTPGPTGYAVESLGPTVNSERSEADVFVDPQQRFLGRSGWASTGQRRLHMLSSEARLLLLFKAPSMSDIQRPAKSPAVPLWLKGFPVGLVVEKR